MHRLRKHVTEAQGPWSLGKRKAKVMNMPGGKKEGERKGEVRERDIGSTFQNFLFTWLSQLFGEHHQNLGNKKMSPSNQKSYHKGYKSKLIYLSHSVYSPSGL